MYGTTENTSENEHFISEILKVNRRKTTAKLGMKPCQPQKKKDQGEPELKVGAFQTKVPSDVSRCLEDKDKPAETEMCSMGRHTHFLRKIITSIPTSRPTRIPADMKTYLIALLLSGRTE